MSKHSEQHRTLIDLLRERGTISQDERLPEDDLFENDGAAEAYGIESHVFRSSRNDQDSSNTIRYDGSSQQDAGRERDPEDEAFATALGEPLYLQAQLPAGVEPVYGAREMVERGPVRNDLLPQIVSTAWQLSRDTRFTHPPHSCKTLTRQQVSSTPLEHAGKLVLTIIATCVL